MFEAENASGESFEEAFESLMDSVKAEVENLHPEVMSFFVGIDDINDRADEVVSIIKGML